MFILRRIGSLVLALVALNASCQAEDVKTLTELDQQRDDLTTKLRADPPQDSSHVDPAWDLIEAYRSFSAAHLNTPEGRKADNAIGHLQDALCTHGKFNFSGALMNNFARFPLLTPKTDDKGNFVFQKLTLNRHPVYGEFYPFDGFRFTAEDTGFLMAMTTGNAVRYTHIVGEKEWIEKNNGYRIISRSELPEGTGIPASDTSTRVYITTQPNLLIKGETYLCWFRLDTIDEFDTWINFSFRHVPDHTEDTSKALGIVNKVPELEKAANEGNADAQFRLGAYYADDISTEIDYVKSAEWLKKAIAQKNPAAMYKLGDLYAHRKIKDPFAEKSLLWTNAAELGNVDAMKALASLYDAGTMMDPPLSFKWNLRAANLGHKLAQYEVGEAYRQGFGVEANPVEAVKWYRLAAAQNVREAQTRLGQFYLDGLGVEKNDEEAIYWLRRGAQDGCRLGHYFLAKMHYEGHGVVADYPRAIDEFRNTADRGYPREQQFAKYSLGLAYLAGNGVERDVNEGLNWLRKSAGMRDGDAALLLAKLYEAGEVVEKNELESNKWYQRAADLGNAAAAQKLHQAEQHANREDF